MEIVNDNIETLKKIFPSIVTENKIDFNKLRLILGDEVDENDEKYQFTWKGKTQAIKLSQTPSTATLIPCIEKSKNWNKTKNLYIEGDNLEVLKLLQKTYFGKVGMIYIDPPYNTGMNLVYKNDFAQDIEDYLKFTNQMDEDGRIYSANPDTSGRFHSDWLSMMYSRLVLARNLLKNDGIIAIAIDDNEVHNLTKICIEIFGEGNYIGCIVTRCNPQGRGKKNIDPCHEYHLIFAKDYDSMPDLRLKNIGDEVSYKNFMRSGTNSRKTERPKRFYPMLEKNGVISCIEPDEYKKIYDEQTKVFDNEYIKQLNLKYSNLGYHVIWPIAANGEEKVWQRVYDRAKVECSTYRLNGRQIQTPSDDYRTPMSLWTTEQYSNVAYGTNKLIELFDGEKVFDYSKSIFTVKDIVNMVDADIVLDFFSGSATTAQAVMELNIEDTENRNRQFICVQLPEKITDNNLVEKGYNVICDVGEARIKKAGDKLYNELELKLNNSGLFTSDALNPNDIDFGFKVFKLNSTNIRPWDSSIKLDERTIFNELQTIKEDRSNLDVAYEIMLKYGVFNMPLEEVTINNKKMFNVGSGFLIIDLDDDITLKDVEAIGKVKPHCVIFKESGFRNNDNIKMNAVKTLQTFGVQDVKSL